MEIIISELKKSDYKKAVKYAIIGMHFNWYFTGNFPLKLYGWYFWYLELMRATQVIAAYVNDEFAGVLLAEFSGEDKEYTSFWKKLYVKTFEFMQNTFYKEGSGLYEKTAKAIQAEYMITNSPDGEIIFLAADPEAKIKGIGTALISELERREQGKSAFLHTDSGCTYQFYEHRGFKRECERDIVMDIGRKKVPLKCFIYSRTFK